MFHRNTMRKSIDFIIFEKKKIKMNVEDQRYERREKNKLRRYYQTMHNGTVHR